MGLLLGSFIFVRGLTVSPDTSGVTNSTADNPCRAGIEFRVNGTEFACDGAGSYTVSRGSWLDSGSSSDVWIERVISAGSLDIDAGSGRLNLGTARLFEVQDATIPGGAVTCTLTFDFWNAASGGTKIGSSGSIVLSAERTA